MASELGYWVEEKTNPYYNIALEEELLHAAAPGRVILYLWQNKNTVVIGRNQNCRAECRVEELERDGGHLARRLSGGGAVFHDLGNLNFTFLAHRDSYDLDRQMEVILRAVGRLGITAERTGRNDIAAQGRKFSGNAFYSSGEQKYHHGTLLLSADMSRLGRYLSVSAEKLKAHGVQSVRSRVVNLCELNPDITVQSMTKAMLDSFSEVYGLPLCQMTADDLDPERLSRRQAHFASDAWRLGAEKDFSCTVSGRFGWGGAELCLRISGNRIAEVALYTDALEDDLADRVSESLAGCSFSGSELYRALQSLADKHPGWSAMLGDLRDLSAQLFE